MEQLHDFLYRHTADCIKNAYAKKMQSVEILKQRTDGHFIVLDAPEYDFMWHRMSFLVGTTRTMPLCGRIQIEWPAATFEETKYEHFEFGPHHSFGDALEKLQNAIWKKIADD